jgi:hypothetical protein
VNSHFLDLANCLDELDGQQRTGRPDLRALAVGLAAALRSGAALLDLAATGTPLRIFLAGVLGALPVGVVAAGRKRQLLAELGKTPAGLDQDCALVGRALARLAEWLRRVAARYRLVDAEANPPPRPKPWRTPHWFKLQQVKLVRLLRGKGWVPAAKVIRALWPGDAAGTERLRGRLRQLVCTTQAALRRLRGGPKIHTRRSSHWNGEWALWLDVCAADNP